MFRIAGAVVFVTVTLLSVFAYFHARDERDISGFLAVYDGMPTQDQQRIAARYLERYSARQLLGELEKRYPYAACHRQSHSIGRAVYDRTQNFTDSIAACGTGCNDGCFHGALMELFSTDSDTLGGVINDEDPQEYLGHVRAEAASLCARPDVASLVQTVFCTHGLGHVFSFVTNYDLPSAIESCNIFKNIDARAPCASGVFMEYMANTAKFDELTTKGLEPCDAYPSYEFQCFRYKAPHFIKAWGGLKNALDACREFDAATRVVCFKGIGFAVGRSAMFENGTVEQNACPGQSVADTDVCVDGAISRVVSTTDKQSNEACNVMKEPYKARCIEWLEKQREVTIE